MTVKLTFPLSVGNVADVMASKDAEIERLVSQERERCAAIADSMNSTQNIGDRIRHGLGD